MTESARHLVVVDSSALVALLTDSGEIGEWVADAVTGVSLATPHLAWFEAANILGRQQLRGDLDATAATLAHQDLLALPMRSWPYTLIAERAWELRKNVTMYDAAYVALAELLEAPVLTLDRRLARASGVHCPIRLPPHLDVSATG